MNKNLLLKHNNNFNLIRTLAALQVLTVHMFNHFEQHNVIIGWLKVFPGVPVFFFLSGYLISKSYEKNQKNGLLLFFKNRFLRIFPALIVCVIIAPLMVYFSGYFDEVTFSIKQFLIWIFTQLSFFQSYNPQFMRGYGVGVLNGSLWTIAVELQFYFLTPIFFFLFRKNKIFTIMLFAVSLGCNIYIKMYYDWSNVYFKLFYTSSIPWMYMFILGFFFCKYKSLVDFAKKQNILILLVLYVLSMNFIGDYTTNSSNAINPISVLILSFLLVKIAFMNLKIPSKIQNFLDNYDISYGIYIYHMPVINLMLYLSLFSVVYNIVFVFVFTISLAFLSWILVEKRFLKLKN